MTFAPIPPDLLSVMSRVPWGLLLGAILAAGILLGLYLLLTGVSAELDEEDLDNE